MKHTKFLLILALALPAFAQSSYYFGGVNLPNATVISINVPHIAAGTVDIGTVPAGSRWLLSGVTYYNDSASTIITAQTVVKISGTYYALMTASALGANASNANNALAYIFNAGESFAVRTNTGANVVNVYASVIQFDDSANIKSSGVALSAGDNTVYTVPASTTALFVNATYTLGHEQPNSIGVPGVWCYNDGAANRTLNVYNVPSGGSPGGTNQLRKSQVLNAHLNATYVLYPGLAPGDFIVVNSDSGAAAQFCWVTVVEFK